MKVSEIEINNAQKDILNDREFNAEQIELLKCYKSCDIQAFAGTGKTTCVVAKLHILAQKNIWENGKGVCVLSHTNVAIDEIKEKVAVHYKSVLNYPNFVGTFQEFINKFLFSNYLAENGYQIKIQNEYFKYPSDVFVIKEKILGKYSRENIYVKPDGRIAVTSFSEDSVDVTEKLTPDEVAKINKFKNERWKEGKFLFIEAYEYGLQYLRDHPSYAKYLEDRFQFVFIDEVQDCDSLQLEILKIIFENKKSLVLQKIGDVNQEIIKKKWTPSGKILKLSLTERFCNNHSLFVNKFKNTTGGLVGVGSAVENMVLVVNSGTKNEISKSLEYLEQNKHFSQGDDIVICAATEDIVQYLDVNFSKDKNKVSGNSANKIRLFSSISASEIVEYGSRVIYNTAFSQIKLFNKTDKEVRCKLREQDVKREILKMEKALLSGNEYDFNTIEIMLGINRSYVIETINKNTWTDTIYSNEHRTSNGLVCRLSTIHATKGQTHDITILLCFNTKYNKQPKIFDFQKILSYGTEENERHRSMMYVASSRPRKMFVIIMEKTIWNNIKNNDEFKGIKVIDI